MKRHLPIHPLLFALLPVLSLYSANVTEVSPRQVLGPMLVVLAAAILMLLLAWGILKEIRKAGLLTSIALILCFCYGHIVSPPPVSSDAGHSSYAALSNLAKIVLVTWTLIFSFSIYFLRRTRLDFRRLTILLNIVGAVVVAIPTANIALRETGGSGNFDAAPDTAEVHLSIPETPPDIYYIILDRYPSASALKEMHDFANSEFLDYLSTKGFFIGSESHANYAFTQYSLASSLNMEYLDRLSQEVGDEASVDEGPLQAMVQDYKVWRLLKSAGYEFINVGSWWEPTRANKYADVNINYAGQLSEFSMTLLRTTALDPLGTSLGLWGDPRKEQWERVRYEFDRLAEIPRMNQPTFVFAHFICPHPDFVFERNGDFLTSEAAADRTVESQYLDQLAAINEKVKTLVDTLLAESEVPPIIILQGDEGDVPWDVDWNDVNWVQVTDTELREELGILNAYYFPEIDAGTLYLSITPVNSFRQVFNLYFDADLGLLPDRSHISRPGQPYAFYDVTDRLK